MTATSTGPERRRTSAGTTQARLPGETLLLSTGGALAADICTRPHARAQPS